MAGLLDLLGGGGDSLDIYGDLFTDQQKAALRNRELGQGLLRMAGAFGEAAMPSRAPIPFGAVLGKAAAALGGNQDEALKGVATAAQIRDLQSKAKIREQMFGPEANARMDAWLQAIGMGAAPAAAPGGGIPPAGSYIPTPAAPGAPPATPPGLGSQFGVPRQDLSGWGLPPPGAAAPIAPGSGAGLLSRPLDEKQYTMIQQAPGLAGGAGAGMPPFPLAGPGAGGDDEALSGGGAAPAPGDPRGLVPYIRERATALGINPDVAVKVAQSEGLGSFQSNVIQRSGRREPSYGAFQLYTGGGMGNEFQRATGLDPADPKNELKTIDYALENAVRTGWTPWHGAKGAGIGSRTGLPDGPTYAEGGGDTVIPSGRGLPANMLRTVADTGGGAPGLPPPPVPQGVNPAAMNALLIELARRNAAAEALGMGNPYGSMLSVLQGSPQYKAAIESATRGAGLPFVRREAEEKAAGTFPFEAELKRYQAALDRANKEAEMLGAARYDPAEIKVSDGKGGFVIVQGTREQKVMAANGFAVPALGIIGITPPAHPGGAGAPPAPGAAALPSDATTPPPAGSLARMPAPTEADKAAIQARGAAQTAMYQAGQKALDTAHDAVRGANQRTPYYASMLTAMQGFQPGATADMRLTGMQYLKDLGVIKGDNVSQGEALRLAGERLAFLAVPPNQGSWSNVERQLLKSSIAGMSMTPEGLTEAIRMMQQLDDYDRKVSEIHRKVAGDNKGLPNLLEAQRRVEALGPPLSAQQEAALEALRQPGAASAAAGAPATTVPSSTTSGAIQTPWGTVTPIPSTAPGTIVPIPPRH